MRLKNKKTGEIREARIVGEHLQLWSTDLEEWIDYDDLDYLVKWWERYEEPKDYWAINMFSLGLDNYNNSEDDIDKFNKSIGNFFVTKEQAEKAVEKLKAWKRLKDKGFRFDGIEIFSEGLLEIDGVLPALEGADNAERLKIIDDLDLLFSMKDE